MNNFKSLEWWTTPEPAPIEQKRVEEMSTIKALFIFSVMAILTAIPFVLVLMLIF